MRLELGDIGLLQHLTLHKAKQGGTKSVRQLNQTIHKDIGNQSNPKKQSKAGNVERGYLLHLGLGDEGLGDALEAVVEDLGDRGGDGLRLLGRDALRLQLSDLRSSTGRARASASRGSISPNTSRVTS